MRFKNILPLAYNMSFGLIPVILTMILTGVLPAATAVYTGALTGIVYLIGGHYLFKEKLTRFILIITTSLLLGLSFLSLLPRTFYTNNTLSIGLEISIVILLLTFYVFSKKIKSVLTRQKNSSFRQNIVHSIDATEVSIRITLILGILHLLIILLYILFSYPLSSRENFVLLQLLPPALFIMAILFNFAGLVFFNQMMSRANYIPIVDEKGNVIGRTVKVEAINYKNAYINPVVRIAVIYQGMLFLCRKSQKRFVDGGKLDIPLECYLKYGESLEECSQRLVEDAFPGTTKLEPRFSIKYLFKNQLTNRLIYLFTLDLTDDSLLHCPRFKDGKLWTMHQIQQNIGKEVFGECFENEFDYLNDIIYIKEIYRES